MCAYRPILLSFLPSRWAGVPAVIGRGGLLRGKSQIKSPFVTTETDDTAAVSWVLEGAEMKARLNRILCDERGGETIEYALVLGLIIVAAIVVIGAVGTKVLAHWTSVNSTLG